MGLKFDTATCPGCKCNFRIQEPGQTLCNSCKNDPNITETQKLKAGKEIVINAKPLTEDDVRRIVREELNDFFREETELEQSDKVEDEKVVEIQPDKTSQQAFEITKNVTDNEETE